MFTVPQRVAFDWEVKELRQAVETSYEHAPDLAVPLSGCNLLTALVAKAHWDSECNADTSPSDLYQHWVRDIAAVAFRLLMDLPAPQRIVEHHVAS